jgi:hypothetical protein
MVGSIESNYRHEFPDRMSLKFKILVPSAKMRDENRSKNESGNNHEAIQDTCTFSKKWNQLIAGRFWNH